MAHRFCIMHNDTPMYSIMDLEKRYYIIYIRKKRVYTVYMYTLFTNDIFYVYKIMTNEYTAHKIQFYYKSVCVLILLK